MSDHECGILIGHVCAECGKIDGSVLRAACETYLRENGWEASAGWPGEWTHSNVMYRSIGHALDVQFARDGIGGAT